jgi:hypothetical protein
MKTNLKHILLVAGIFALVSTASFAQERRAGIKGGLNVSNLYVDDVDDENARYGFNVGLFGEIISTETFGLQAELLYSTKGSKNDFNFGSVSQEAKFNLNYLDVPVLAVFKLGESVDLQLGGYASYLLAANTSTKGDLGSGVRDWDKDNFNSFDYGLVGGIGFNFGAAQVGARYNYGLAKIADSNDAKSILGDAKNSFGQIYLALNLNHQ